jgi:RP/EB family microtubule-associated protein
LVLDSIYGDVPIQKVKFDATQEFHFVHNFKLLQQAFTKHKIDKVIPVDRLVKCKFQDNLEFLQWIKKYWEQHVSPDREYDASARRGVVQTPMSVPARKVPQASTAQKKPTQRPLAPSRATSTPQRNGAPMPQRSASTHSFKSDSVSEELPSVSDRERQAWVAREGQLIATCQAMTEEVTQLRVAVDTMEKERDFYFNRLREIEIVVQEKLEVFWLTKRLTE